MASKKKVTGGKRPQNLRRTLGQFSAYLGRHRIMIGLVALLAAISALAALFGTYMIRPVVNGLLENGSVIRSAVLPYLHCGADVFISLVRCPLWAIPS